MTRMGHDSGLSAHVQCAKHIMGLRWIEMMKMLLKIVIGNRIIIKYERDHKSTMGMTICNNV